MSLRLARLSGGRLTKSVLEPPYGDTNQEPWEPVPASSSPQASLGSRASSDKMSRRRADLHSSGCAAIP